MNSERLLISLSFVGRLKFLFTDSLVYGLANALNASMLLLLFPLLAKELSVENYGLFDFVISAISAVTIMFIFGQDSAVARFFYDSSCFSVRRSVVSSSFFFQTLVCVFGVFLIWLFGDVVGEYFSVFTNDKIMYLSLIQIPCFMLINFSQNILKWTFEKNKFLFVSLGNSFVTLVATFIFVVFFDFGLYGALLSFSVSRLLFSFVGIYFVRRWIALSWSFVNFKSMLLYALPYGFICVLNSLFPVVERFFVLNFSDTSELGFYAAATKVAMLASLPIYAFQTAWGPFYLSIFSDSGSKKVFHMVMVIFTSCILSVAVLSSLVGAPLISFLVGEEYYGASKYIPFIAVGLGVYSISSITSVGIDIEKVPRLRFYGYVFSFLSFLMLSPVLVGHLGSVGVALALSLASLSRLAIETFFSAYVSRLRFGYFRCLIFVFLFYSVYVLGVFYFGSMLYSLAGILFALCFFYLIFELLLSRK